MTDLDAALDAVKADKDTAAWHANRAAGFGCSDLPALYAILGWVSPEEWGWVQGADGKWTSEQYRKHHKTGEVEYRSPRYLLEQTLVMKRCGLPRLIAEKAGLAKGRAQSDAMAEGKKKEATLFRHSRLGSFSATAVYAPDMKEMPERWAGQVVGRDPWVLRDTVEPRMLCTVEAFEIAPNGLVAVELKTDRLGLRKAPPWYQALQACGQAVVLGADAWSIIYGPGWAQTDEPSFPDLPEPVEFGPYPVREDDRLMIRRAVRMGWALVEKALAR